ncbi:MAG: translation initiation factor IF-2, partial [Planctomycetota bacterium]|nr:translation initiation factor IF-2 [Planctomycetota bacterium]
LEEELAEEERQQSELYETGETVERPPVVTFMGHVDHGKTSLLDAIRNTRVAAGEHGGITQHIGAYSVERNGKRVTFLDTPGHEAFSAMRARGANLTDIAVLVVAADDGVMPQTEEAAAHAKNAGVPVVIAINKCDMPSANPDRVRQELANRLGLLPEEWGGQVGMINVSAHTKQGIDKLVERILLEAEVLELRANPSRPATGHVVEARMSEGQGVVATLLVGDGSLHVGDVILCSNGYGKIRLMFDEFGRPIKTAYPGTPVRLSGLSVMPEAGDKFFILSDLLKARAIAEQRERETRAAAMARRQHVTLENLTSHLAGSGKRELGVIVKADVVGSLEVIEKTLRDMSTSEVGISIIHAAVGGINHADVILADASDAIVLGFHVGAENQARSAAASLGVQIRTYHVIYRIIEDMKAALEGLLPPEEREVVQGHVDIRRVFRSSKVGAIAGCYVVDGQVQRSNRIRLFRDQVMIYEGAIQSLRRVKDDVREVKAGFECGIKIAGYDAIEDGDVIEAFSIEEVARKL